jgi:hypothetical protein
VARADARVRGRLLLDDDDFYVLALDDDGRWGGDVEFVD